MTAPSLILANGDGGTLPLHPIFVNFTAGLLPVAMVFDLLGAVLKKDALRNAAWWTLLAAAAVTPLTAATGWWWSYHREHAGHWQLGIHQWLGTGVAVALIPLALWRGHLYRKARRPGWAYACAPALLLAAALVQGELGASMSFDRGIFIHGGDDDNGPGSR